MPHFVTFTPNPALDVSTSVDRLVDAHKLRCEAPLIHPGGGGVNVARVLHRLGAQVLAVYPAGGPNGERLHELLASEGVADGRVPLTQETRESFTAHEHSTGREYRFVLPGPTLTSDEWQACLTHLQSHSPRWIISSGSLPPGVPTAGHAQVAHLARRVGARMVVDSAGPPLLAALDEGVWLFKPSLRELTELTGAPLPSRQEQRQAAQALIAKGRTQMVALSLGAEGAMLVTAEQCLLADPLQVPVAGSVGAGDSFLAGLVWALDRQNDLTQALATAVAAGAAAVMSPGTALCQSQDIQRLSQQVRIGQGCPCSQAGA